VSSLLLREATRLLLEGGVVACPTESVYGLHCDPLDYEAVQQILNLKQRADAKGFILIASQLDQLLPFVSIPEQSKREVLASWPGPHTWIVPAVPNLPWWISGGRTTVAVRVTDHPIIGALCDNFNGCLISTSANTSGKPPARSALRVRAYFDDKVGILNGALGNLAKPTTIRDAVSGKIIRA